MKIDLNHKVLNKNKYFGNSLFDPFPVGRVDDDLKFLMYLIGLFIFLFTGFMLFLFSANEISKLLNSL